VQGIEFRLKLVADIDRPRHSSIMTSNPYGSEVKVALQ
jgi:hypothetical protein